MTPTIEIITPEHSYRGDVKPRKAEAEKFERSIIDLLELPDNWNKYLTFGYTKSFVILKENTVYNSQVFRRFTRGKIAIIPDELKEATQQFVKHKTEWANEAQTIKERNEKYRTLLGDILKPFNTDTITVAYQSNNDLAKCWVHISIIQKGEYSWTDKELGSITINHEGKISKPVFSHDFHYANSLTIETVQEWIENKKEVEIILQELVQKVKAVLPQDFYTQITQQ